MAAPEGEPVPIPVPELEPVPVTVAKPVPDPVPVPVPAPVQSDRGATEAASSQRRRRGADAAWRSLNAAARGVAAAVRGFGRIEALVAGLALVLMAVLPLADMVTRWRGHDGVPGARPLVQHLMLWVAMLGAGLAAREGRLLALATPQLIRSPLLRRTSNIVAGTLLAGVCALLFRSSLELSSLSDRPARPSPWGCRSGWPRPSCPRGSCSSGSAPYGVPMTGRLAGFRQSSRCWPGCGSQVALPWRRRCPHCRPCSCW
jgi:TRAP-type C4-dicarboxylate transport system permease small subunit